MVHAIAQLLTKSLRITENGVYRKTGQRDEVLERLLGERDHVNIQLSLLGNSEPLDDELINSLRDKLEQLEVEIEWRHRAIQGQSIFSF